MKLFHLFATLLATTFIHSQVATVSNNRPSRGSTIEISYTPDSVSVFQLDDEIYVSYSQYGEDYSISYETKKMKRVEDRLIYELQIDTIASAYDIYFRNLEKSDYPKNLEVKPVNKEGRFYRNSYRSIADSDLDAYQKEMRLFPENYSLFVSRWRKLDYHNKDSAKAIITSELEKIAFIKKGNPENMEASRVSEGTIEFALSLGYAVLGDFESAWPYFVELFEDYDDLELQNEAQSLYHYLLYSYSADDSQFKELIYRYIKSNPTSLIAKDWMRSVDNPNDSDRETLRNIAGYWMKKIPSDAKVKYYYAKATQDKGDKIYYLNQSLNAFLDKSNSVKMYYSSWSSITFWIIRIIEEFNNAEAYAQALSLIEMLEKNSNKKSAELYRLKGGSYQSLCNYTEAFKWYSLSADMGDEVALDSAKAVFAKMNLYNVKQEDYRNQVLLQLFYEEDVLEAPKFNVTDIYGNSYKSEDLQDKVVVLNFWFIGCAPCIKEMPDLNKMVKDYEGKEIVFIAFANDSKGNLEKFLGKRDFEYNVIPSAYPIAQSYNVTSFPTHVIIDKKGNIRSTITGTAKEKDLTSYIDRVLRF